MTAKQAHDKLVEAIGLLIEEGHDEEETSISNLIEIQNGWEDMLFDLDMGDDKPPQGPRKRFDPENPEHVLDQSRPED